MFLQLNLDNVINAVDILDFHIMKDPNTQEYVLYARRESGAFAIYSDIIKSNVDKVLCDILALMKEVPLDVESQITTSVPPEVVSVTAPKQVIKGEPFEVVIRLKGYVKSKAEIQITKEENLTETKELTLSSDNLTATVTYTATNPAEETISAKTAMGSLTKSATVSVKDTAPILTTFEVSNATLRRGDVTKAIATFDKVPKVENINFVVEGLKQHSKKAVAGSTVTQDFKWEGDSFEAKIIAIAKNKTETKIVKLENDATIQEIVPTKTQLEIGEESTLAIFFDKPLVEHQVPLKETYPVGVEETQELQLNKLKNSGTLKIRGTSTTNKPITFELGGQTIKYTIPVLPAKKAIAMETDKTKVELGDTFNVTVTFNRPITKDDNFEITLSEGLQSNKKFELIENGIKGILKVKANAIGDKTIDIGDLHLDIDVMDFMEIVSIETEPEENTLGAEVNLTITFSHTPVLKSATIRTSGGLMVKEGLRVVGNTIVGMLKTLDTGEQIVICEYNGLKPITHIVKVGEPPKPEITIGNNPSMLRLNQKQILTISLTNATDYDVFNDNPCCISFNKKTKEVKAIGWNGYKTTLTFTPTTPRDLGTPKSITIDIPKPTPLFDSVSAEPISIKENEKTVVTMSFNELAPDLEKITMQPNGFLKMEGKITLEGMKAKATFVGVTAGAGEVSCKYDDGVPKTANVTVTSASSASRTFTTKVEKEG